MESGNGWRLLVITNNISQYIFYEQEFQTLGTIKKENDAFLAKEKRQAVYVSKEKR